MSDLPSGSIPQPYRPGSDKPFLWGLIILGGSYALIIALMIAADVAYVDADSMLAALNSPEIQFSIVLSLVSCSLSTIFSYSAALIRPS